MCVYLVVSLNKLLVTIFEPISENVHIEGIVSLSEKGD